MATSDFSNAEEISSTFKTDEEKFVTVVSVHDEDHPESKFKESGEVHVDLNSEINLESMNDVTPPLPAPRHFVTVVSVESSSHLDIDGDDRAVLKSSTKVRLDVPGHNEERSSFLARNEAPMEAVVYRLPGERLGFGLKFDGGMGSTENIRRLFIQSIAPDSPAARATVPWGKFEPGDEIVLIEGVPVSSLTRVECVTRLKEASVKLNLGVFKGDGTVPSLDNVPSKKEGGKRPPPPPLPLRSHSRKVPARPPKDGIPPPEGFGDTNEPAETEEELYGNVSEREVFSNGIDALPPTPAFYLDLLSEEEKRSRLRYESESDETNSSASTVVDKLSISSSRTVSRNSSFNAAMEYSHFDLARAVSPFEHLEDEINKAETIKSSNLQMNEDRHFHMQHNLESEKESPIGSAFDSNEEFNSLVIMQNKVDSLDSKPDTGEFEESLLKKDDSASSHKVENIEENRTNSSSNSGCLYLKKSCKRLAPLPPMPRNTGGSEISDQSNGLEDSLQMDDDRHPVNNLEYLLSKDRESSPQSPILHEAINREIQLSEYSRSFEASEYDEESLAEPCLVRAPRLTFINKTYDSNGLDICSFSNVKSTSSMSNESRDVNVKKCISDDDVDDGGGGGDDSDEDVDYPFYEKPLETVSNMTVSTDDSIEPIDINAYEDSSYFVDRVSNPSYGLPFTEMNIGNMDMRDYPDKLDDIYEEIDSSLDSLKTDDGESKTGTLDDSKSTLSLDSSSEEVDIGSQDNVNLQESYHDKDNPEESSPIYENQRSEDISQLAGRTSFDSQAKSFTHLKRNTRIRNDLSEILKKEMKLQDRAQVLVQEEEEIESKIECETEEEVLLVLRALRSDNSLYLEEGQESTEIVSSAPPPPPVVNLQVPPKSPQKRKQSHDSKFEKGLSFSDFPLRQTKNRKVITEIIPESYEEIEFQESESVDIPTLPESKPPSLIESNDQTSFETFPSPDSKETPVVSSGWLVMAVEAKSPVVDIASDPNVEISQNVTQEIEANPPSIRSSSAKREGSDQQSRETKNKTSELSFPPKQNESTSKLIEAEEVSKSSFDRHQKPNVGMTEGGGSSQNKAAIQQLYDCNKKFLTQVEFSSVTIQTTSLCAINNQPAQDINCVPKDPSNCTENGSKESTKGPNQTDEKSTISTIDTIEKGQISSLSEVPTLNETKPQSSEVLRKEQGDSALALYEHRCSTISSQDSPPSYSRLPPDGHEFPANYTEGLQDKISRFNKYSTCLQDIEYDASNSSLSSSSQSTSCSPSTLPRGPSKSPVTPPYESRSLSRWRRQDEKSERSVKDKIAMFSSEKDSPSKSRKLNRSESISSVSSEKSSSTKSSCVEESTQDRSKKESSPDKFSSAGNLTRPSFRSMLNVNTADFESKENVKPPSRDKEKGVPNPTNVSSEQKDVTSGLNTRSQSLLDIDKNGTSRMKRHSVGAYDRPFVYKYGVEKPEERERRTSLTNLIEQRRKSMSKLRGLIIPETKSGDEVDNRVPINLPKISSNTSSQNMKTMSLPRETTKVTNSEKGSSPDQESISTKYSTSGTNSLKSRYRNSSSETRKNSIPSSLPPSRPRSTPSPSPNDFSGTSTPRKKSPQRTFENYGDRRSDSLDSEEKQSIFGKIPSPKSVNRKQGCENRYARSAEDSDNDSAVSSTQSSFSQGLSPRDSPMPDISDQEDNHYPYQSVRPRHSSQSSFDEVESKRVLKSGSIEAKNRRNIIKSAKCSSGRSSDEQSTPEITRKHLDFSSENSVLASQNDSRTFPRRRNVQREPSYDSTSSASSRPSSRESSSRRNSKESVVHLSNKSLDNAEFSTAQQIYLDKNGDMYKESQIKVAYLNEISDNFEELNDPKEIIAEIRIPSKLSNLENQSEVLHNVKDEKWNTLEQKYSDSRRKTIENSQSKFDIATDRWGVNNKKTNFEAVASKWKQRTEEDPSPRRPQGNTARKDSPGKSDRPKQDATTSLKDAKPKVAQTATRLTEYSSSSESRLQADKNSAGRRPTSLDVPRADIDRKYSVPEYGSSVKYRAKKEGSGGEISSRPTSLIEGNVELNPLQQDDQYIVSLSSSISTDSHEDLLDSSESSLSRAGSKEVLNAFMKPQINSVIPKMSEIIKAFERHDLGKKGVLNHSTSHPRMSSLDSTASDDGSQALYGSVSSLASGQRDQYGSITSLSSSTSIISPQELAQLIEEANHSLEESGTPSHEILVVVLHREVIGYGSIGITLAGGADYDTKEITVHKIIPGSLADRDGRIQKGDRVISINGKTLRGVTHREALNILKSPRPEVVLVLSRSRSVTPQETTFTHSNGVDAETGFSHRPVFINHVPPPRPPKILESPMDSKSLVSDLSCETVPRGPPLTINLIKEGAGLGFSLEGGKDSPLGDRPLTIKKIFSGGAADKGGVLKIGDELLSVNSVDLTNMARIEAWNFLKKLPDGTVALVIRQKLKDGETNANE